MSFCRGWNVVKRDLGKVMSICVALDLNCFQGWTLYSGVSKKESIAANSVYVFEALWSTKWIYFSKNQKKFNKTKKACKILMKAFNKAFVRSSLNKLKTTEALNKFSKCSTSSFLNYVCNFSLWFTSRKLFIFHEFSDLKLQPQFLLRSSSVFYYYFLPRVNKCKMSLGKFSSNNVLLNSFQLWSIFHVSCILN